MILLPAWLGVLLILLVLALLVGMWASLTATRLNRLHIRTDAARIKLEGALAARLAAVVAMAPSLTALANDVSRVPLRATDMSARSDKENLLLTKLTPEVSANPSFIDASAKVDLAARFYNDAVSDTREVRSRFLIRAFHLAGFAPLPQYYEAVSTGHVH